MQIDDQRFVDADWVYLEQLSPFLRISWATGQLFKEIQPYLIFFIFNKYVRIFVNVYLDSSGKIDNSANFQTITLVGLYQRSVPQARRVISHFNGAGGVIFHLDGRSDFLKSTMVESIRNLERTLHLCFA